MGDMRNAYEILIVNPEEKRLLGKPRHRWKEKNNIKEIGWDDVESGLICRTAGSGGWFLGK
jgi:hypothetical protein